jgi:integral membrane protein (TIGR01906 family)
MTTPFMRRPEPIVPRVLVFLFSASLVYFVLYVALISLLLQQSTYTHITDITQQKQNAAIIDYLRWPFFTPNELSFLSDAEASHMADVKETFNAAFILWLAATGIIAGIVGTFTYHSWWSRIDELFTRSLRASGWTLLAIALFLVLASLLNFERLWLIFHAIFFPQGNWMFSPDSILITLYPSAFFERFVLRWLLSISSFGIVAIVVSYLRQQMRRHDELFTAKFEQKAHKAAQHHRKK